jgi:cobalt/nickel transport protein
MVTGKSTYLKAQSHKKIFLPFLVFMTIHVLLFSIVSADDKWPGVDKAVVEKFAKEKGREAKPGLINAEQGDLLLFAFLVAGAAGGFAAGYYWRVLMERKKKDEK